MPLAFTRSDGAYLEDVDGRRYLDYHAAFACPSCFTVEFSTIHNPLRHELLVEPLAMRDGSLAPPTAPGLGLQIDASTISRYPFQPGFEVRMANVRGPAAAR